jgi:O-antigen ligase
VAIAGARRAEDVRVPSRPETRPRELGRGWDRLGLVLAGAGVAWAAISAAVNGGRPLPLSLVFLGTVGAVLGSARLPVLARRALLATVAAGPMLLAVRAGELLGDGPLGYANASGSAFVVAAAAALTLASSTREGSLRRVLQLAATGMLLVALALGAVTASLVGVLVAAVATFPVSSTRRIVSVLGSLFGCLLLATAALGITYTVGPRTSFVDRLVDGTLGELRVKLWSEALAMVADRPLVGFGPGRFSEISPTAAVRPDAAWAHSEWFQTAAETGLPGGLLVLALLAWVVTILWHRDEARAAVVVVAVLGTAANATFDYVLREPAIWLGLAVLVGASADLGPARRPLVGRLPRGSVVATLVLIGALSAPSDLLNPTHGATNAVTQTPDGALAFPAPGEVRSTVAPVELYEALGASEAFSIELWAATDDADQDGPARLVTSSRGIVHRNVTLGQEGDALVVRIRTSDTDWNAIDDELTVPEVFADDALHHLVVSTDLGSTAVWVDGELRWRGGGPGGSLVSWNHTYPLLLGNEATGDRPWLGTLAGVTIHDRALDDGDVTAAFQRGPDGGTGDEPGSVAAAYRFDGPDDARFADRSQRQLGPDLVAPATVATSPPSLLRTLTSSVDQPALRVSAHLAAFLVWTLLVGLGPRPLTGSRRAGVIAAGLVVAVGVSILRHGAGGAPSWLDVLGACLGLLLGTVIVARVRRSRWPPPDLPSGSRL